jgi:cytochrome o ubiquinol oxidase subunit IV
MADAPLYKDIRDSWHGSLKGLIFGLIISLVLTGSSFLVVWLHPISHSLVKVLLLVNALFQALIQVGFFLHVGKESKPKWRLVFFILVAGALAVILLGSVWIMYSLNSRVMPMGPKPFI